MAILHEGVLRATTIGDVITHLENNHHNAGRHLDCLAWDALGYSLEPIDGDGWPTWSNSQGELRHCAVPEFSVDLQATLEEVFHRGGDLREFMDALVTSLSGDPSLIGAEYVRVLPIAAITLCVLRYGTM